MSENAQQFITLEPLGSGRAEFGSAKVLGGLSSLFVDAPSVTTDKIYPKAALEDPMVISRRAHESMLDELNALRSRVSALESTINSDAGLDCRIISDEDAKSEIAVFFRAHDGEELYPSDIAHALLLDYDQVSRILDELDAEGKIGAAR